MAEAKISDEMERGCLKRQPNDQDTTIKKALARKITEDINLNEGEEAGRRWNKNSISKVPAHMVAVNPEAFKPKMVSMGPYHHEQEQLKPMEEHKHRAARCFIEKSKKSIEDYIEALWKVLPDLMGSYSQLSHSWRNDNHGGTFLTLMLIDGCFLLEMLNVYNENFDGYRKEDPIFSPQGTISNPQIKFDLMMLENQVPFTAIETISTVQDGGKTPPAEICKKIKNLMSNALLEKPHPVPDEWSDLHMLDIVREVFAVQHDFVVAVDSTTDGEKSVSPNSRSVIELQRAGVVFKVAKDDSSPSFELDGTGVPTIHMNQISVESEISLCNMVAFEHLHPGMFPSTLCYCTFLNGLLTSAADVRNLRDRGIIKNTKSRDYVTVKTFKKLVLVNVPMDQRSELHKIQVQLDEFYKGRMTGCKGKLLELVASWKQKWIPNLKQKYNKNPWTVISVVAATILMALTIAQTYYAARSYWDSSHKKN